MLAAIDILLFSAYGSYFTSSPSVVENDRLFLLILITSRRVELVALSVMCLTCLPDYFTILITQSTASASATSARIMFVLLLLIITRAKVFISPDTSNISRYFLQTLQIKGFAEKYKNCQNLLFQDVKIIVI
jgi:hypothetical protein